MVIDKDIRAHDFLRGGPKWRIILGSKGQDFFNPSYLWTPYITTDITVADNFTPRYANNNRYYSTLTQYYF